MDASGIENLTKRRTELRVTVHQQIPLALEKAVFAVGQISSNLLHPQVVRTRRESGEAHASRGDLHHEQQVERDEAALGLDSPEAGMVLRSPAGGCGATGAGFMPDPAKGVAVPGCGTPPCPLLGFNKVFRELNLDRLGGPDVTLEARKLPKTELAAFCITLGLIAG